MIKLLNAAQLATIPATPQLVESRLDGDKLGWFHAYNLSPYLFEVQDDTGQVRGVMTPGELVLPLLVRTERLFLNPVSTLAGAFPVPSGNFSVYVEIAEQEPRIIAPLLPSPGSAGAPGIVRLEDGASAILATVWGGGQVDGLAQPPALDVLTQGYVYNGAAWDRARSASAAAMAAQSGLGAPLAAPPGEWTAQSAAAVGVASSAGRAAGGAGVRHVARRVSFGFSATTALGAIVTVTINLRDGATGAGTVLWAWQFTLPAAVIPAFTFGQEVNFPGSAATAMTLEFSAAVANLLTFCNLGGFDAS